jgi:hypothetical protein
MLADDFRPVRTRAMARIEPLPDERIGWLARFTKWAVARRIRKPPTQAWNLLAHHKGVLAANVAYMAVLDRWRRLPRRLKRLVHLRVAMRVGCPS